MSLALARVGFVSVAVLAGCAGTGSIVLKDPATGKQINCALNEPGDQVTAGLIKSMGRSVDDVVKQCVADQRSQGWVCVSGC